MKTMYMAIDQYGTTHHGLTHPAKDLCNKLGYSKARRMFIDDLNGSSFHVGYIVGPFWLTLYEIKPYRKGV